MKPIIRVENLSKQYRLGTIGTGTVRDDFQRWLYRIQGKEDPFLKIGEANNRRNKGESDYVWALKNINFEVMPGEVLGIIGENGAGKSTLLKILSKVTGPTTGQVDYNGRIGSLLEVGTGFHPELTGRENIFLNGAILGMTKREIRTKLDEIIDFSGCERYIDTPVKRYSSGMTVRLGFSVAAHLDPEILIVDEVLAVGDAEFQKKAIGKMQDVSRNEGRTVLFVSHNIGAVKSLCSTGVIIANGELAFAGSTTEATDRYLSLNYNEGGLITDKITKLHSDITITGIWVNGSASDYLRISGEGNSINIRIMGTLAKSLPLYFEAVLFDENHI
ncbi:ABC transporter ATP-binding protein, partial [Nostoc sp. CHAB 5834]|nr:ABC transporter ATP-binding protein [Nostoc sp. CHAB 5834]